MSPTFSPHTSPQMQRTAPLSHPLLRGRQPSETRPRGAIVIGGDHQGLGIVRSLGRQGIPVWVLDDERSISVASRYATRCLPWPTKGDGIQAQYLVDLAAQHDLAGWAVFPTRDETVAMIARNHPILSEWLTLTTPPWEVTRWAYDKRLTHELAAEAGVDAPTTVIVDATSDLRQFEGRFPWIIKPAIKQDFYAHTHAKAWRVDDVNQLRARYREASALIPADQIMIQELIPGSGGAQFSFAALCNRGDVLASLTARRARQHPMDFGHASTYVETIEHPVVELTARRLLQVMRYTGLVEVEMKHDSRDGKYKILDINARTWGWHTVGRRAGVDFPHLLWRMLQGEQLETIRGQAGVRWARLATDLPTAAIEIARGRMSFVDYARSFRGPIELSVLAPDDPLPALAELALLPYLAFKRGL
ncbi:MAG: ATP-grasp domain-containing protein [Chloroflexota bacterium]